MNRVCDLYIGTFRQSGECLHGAAKTGSEIFPAVAGHEYQLAGRIEPRPGRYVESTAIEPIAHLEDGIDARIPGHCDPVVGHAFANQGRLSPPGWREMEPGEARGQHPIHLLRERLGHVPGAQAGFHVSDFDAMIERGESRRKCGGSIALHEYEIRPFVREDGFEGAQNPGGER